MLCGPVEPSVSQLSLSLREPFPDRLAYPDPDILTQQAVGVAITVKWWTTLIIRKKWSIKPLCALPGTHKLIGASLSEPHTCDTALHFCLYVLWYVRHAEYTYHILFLWPSETTTVTVYALKKFLLRLAPKCHALFGTFHSYPAV